MTASPLRRRSRAARQGFTLVELMVVIVIMAVLVGLGIREYVRMAEDARVKRAKQDLKSFADAIRNYNQREKKPFFKLRSLQSLAGRYIERIPLDPWGHAYGIDGTFVYSLGTDGKPSADDLRLRYERESIVLNPGFATSLTIEENEVVPTSWTFNPRILRVGERGGGALVDVVRDDAGTVSGGNALKVQ